jgi:hypothetical protein
MEHIDKDLESAVAPLGFHERCHKTARQGAALTRMRNEAARAALTLAPFAEWIEQLARMASADPSVVFEWSGMGLPAVSRGAGLAYARLGDALGLSRRFVRALGLLSLAKEAHGDLELVEAYSRGGGLGADAVLAALETELDRVVARLGPKQIARWRELEGEIASPPLLEGP